MIGRAVPGPANARLIVARTIPLPVDTVFAALVDLACQSRWILATRVWAAAGVLPAPPAVGSELVARTAVAGLGVTDTMLVTEHQPPRRWRVRHTGAVLRGWGEWGVLPDCRGSRVYWAEEFELPWGAVGRVGWAVFGPLIRLGIGVSLARLDRGLRSGALVGSAIGADGPNRTAGPAPGRNR